MRAPIFVWVASHGNLTSFDSVEWAEEYTEPFDVDEGVVYDADGRLLAFETDGRRVVLREIEFERTHEKELRAALAQVALARGTQPDPSASLAELVDGAHARARVPPPRRRRRRFASRFAKPS